MNITWIS